jgi:tRNA(His) 5'-end guanylyltransferase
METSLSDRMKEYERTGDASLLPLIPVITRLDGKAFHTFTQGLPRPYDKRLSDLMTLTTTFLVDYTNACIGYTQSDEITLVWLSENYGTEIFMGGRSSKMISLLSAVTTAIFNRNLAAFLPEKENKLPLFDCRVWNVPTKTEACNALVWREQDATRNSVQMAGQSCFSHAQLMNKSCDEIQEMLWQQKQINWNDYPVFFKRGTYVQRREISTPFTAEELEKLPPLHNARKNPNLVVTRHEVRTIELPVFTQIVNREAVVFDGADPQTAKDQDDELSSVETEE